MRATTSTTGVFVLGVALMYVGMALQKQDFGKMGGTTKPTLEEQNGARGAVFLPDGALEIGDDEEVTSSLRAELNKMHRGAVRKRAVQLGIDEDDLEKADDADDTKAALIELIVAHGGMEMEAKEVEMNEETASELLAELKQMQKGALRKRAVQLGIDEDDLEEADDADDTKAVLIELIGAMKKGALRKRAVQLGIGEDDLEKADGADDTKTALIELILAQADEAKEVEAEVLEEEGAVHEDAEDAESEEANIKSAGWRRRRRDRRRAAMHGSCASGGMVKASGGRVPMARARASDCIDACSFAGTAAETACNTRRRVMTSSQNANRDNTHNCNSGRLSNVCPRMPVGKLVPAPFSPNGPYYIDASCYCWKKKPNTKNILHNWLFYYKFIRVNSDCSSSEVQIKKSIEAGDSSFNPGRRRDVKQGSFNYADSEVSETGSCHTTLDIWPSMGIRR